MTGDRPFYPRFLGPRVREALTDTPVVLLHGARQSGKTTLARTIGDEAGYVYLSFDDETLRAAATTDPQGFVMDLPVRVVLDEVQRVPEIFVSLKLAVDRNRVPGRFLLTGSSNVLLLPTLADSLAGRLEALRLHPLSQSELAAAPPRFLKQLFECRFSKTQRRRLGRELVERVVAGGYPAALARATARRRREWYRSYVETLVQRDVRDLSRVSSLEILPKLLQLIATQTSRLLNVSDAAAPFQVSRPTIRAYLTLLERVFLLDTIEPWHRNRVSRLVKTPKLHLTDTGLASALLGADTDSLLADRPLFGQLLETFVLQELRRQASWSEDALTFHHFRDKDQHEVDIVLERGTHEVTGVEVKASGTVTNADFRGLRKLRELGGKSFVCGVVLYDGEQTARFDENLFAVPIAALWEA